MLLIASSAAILDQRGDPGSSTEQGNVEEYLSVICQENDTWSSPSRPCEDMYAIGYQCVGYRRVHPKTGQQNSVSPYCRWPDHHGHPPIHRDTASVAECLYN
jgi:hypothetical protein